MFWLFELEQAKGLRVLFMATKKLKYALQFLTERTDSSNDAIHSNSLISSSNYNKEAATYLESTRHMMCLE